MASKSSLPWPRAELAHLLAPNSTWSSAVLSGADLRRAELIGARMPRALLRRVDLGGAELAAAELSAADLSEAGRGWGRENLTKTCKKTAKNNEKREKKLGFQWFFHHLCSPRAAQAQVEAANLSSCDLRQAILDGAKMSKANLIGAKMQNSSGAPRKASKILKSPAFRAVFGHQRPRKAACFRSGSSCNWPPWTSWSCRAAVGPRRTSRASRPRTSCCAAPSCHRRGSSPCPSGAWKRRTRTSHMPSSARPC